MSIWAWILRMLNHRVRNSTLGKADFVPMRRYTEIQAKWVN